MKKLIKTFNILIALLFIFLFFLSIIKQSYIESIILIILGKTYGLFLIFLVSSLLEFIPQYISPHIILINTKLIGFPISYVLAFTIIGSTIGSLVGFELGRKSGFLFISSIYSEREIRIMQKKINKFGKWYVLVAAVSPLPYVPLAFGSLNLTRNNFLLFGVIPRILGLLLLGFILM